MWVQYYIYNKTFVKMSIKKLFVFIAGNTFTVAATAATTNNDDDI